MPAVEAIDSATGLPGLLPVYQTGHALHVIPANSAGTVVASSYSSSATFTPAATSHAAGDCNGAAATFASVGPSGGGRVLIQSATLRIDNTSAETTSWRLHLYNVTPASAIADDAAWSFADADFSSYLGYIDLGYTGTDAGANQWTQADGCAKEITVPSGGSLFGYLVNDTTATPAAAAHTVELLTVAL